MKKFAFLIGLLFSLECFAQDTTLFKTPDTGLVTIHKDPRIDLLVKKQAQVNEITSRDSRRSAKGFRLMIISTNNRDEVLAAKTKVYTYFPELKVYLWYQAPFYKLKAGNFKERKDAEAYQKKLNVYFPQGIFIMNDVVELKPDKNSEDDL